MNEHITKAKEQINAFIKKYCGEHAAHLLDSDENDGERLRQLFVESHQAGREEMRKECLEAVPEKKKINPYARDLSTYVTDTQINKFREKTITNINNIK